LSSLRADVTHDVDLWTELDSHADTTCAGANCIVLETTQQVVDVTPYNKNKYEPETNIPIVKAATAYTTSTGTTYILVLNQALYLPELDHSLLNPNQMRANGVIVHDCPQHLSDPNKPSTHSLYFPEHQVRIPLEMGGIISRFSSRQPTGEELENCLWLPLTSDLEWDPHSPSFAENEFQMVEIGHQEQRERVIYEVYSNLRLPPSDCYTDNVVVRTLSSITSSLSPKGLCDSIVASIVIPSDRATRLISGMQSDKRRDGVTKEELACMWNIPLKTAAQTIQVTTQKGIRMAVHPIHARYRTKQAHLHYNQLGGRHGRFYTDTMFASIKST